MKKSCDKEKCPFLSDPLEECYCSHMNSQMTEKAVKFCGGNFAECDVYRQHRGHRGPILVAEK